MRRTARRRRPSSEHGGKPPRGSTLVLAALLLAFLPVIGLAQQENPSGDGDMGRMVMPTEDAKVLRLVRPTVAALQAKLAQTGHFEGAVNGLYGPSTREVMAAWQEAKGRTATGWPDLTAVLALMSAERGRPERFADRVDLSAPTEKRGGDASILPGDRTVAGDPRPAKRIRATPERMTADNDQTRALRALRALIGAVQLRLAEATPYSGPVSGRPDEPGLPEALASWQRSRGLGPTGKLDLTTSLWLSGLDPDRLERALNRPVRTAGSPIIMDRELMEESLNRFRGPIRDTGDDDATEGATNDGET